MAAQQTSAAPLLNSSKVGEQEDGGMDEVQNMFASFRQMAGSQVCLLRDLFNILYCSVQGGWNPFRKRSGLLRVSLTKLLSAMTVVFFR